MSYSILGGSHKILQDILDEARECWQKAREEQVSVYASDIRNEWRFITSRPKRPLKSIILNAGVKEAILEDALDFLESKEWYSERGIPFRRGYLLVSSRPPYLQKSPSLLTFRHSMELPDPERRHSFKASPANSIWTFMSSRSLGPVWTTILYRRSLRTFLSIALRSWRISMPRSTIR